MNSAADENVTGGPGGSIRERRRRKGLTQEQLADRAGCSIDYVRLLDRGYVPRYSDVLPRVLSVLNADGSALFVRRQASRLTVQQVSIQTSISEETIRQLEAGEMVPSRTMKERLASALHTSVDEIFPGRAR